jgi:hypothetical protein
MRAAHREVQHFHWLPLDPSPTLGRRGSPRCRRFEMSGTTTVAAALVALAALTGCAKVQVSDRQELVSEQLPRPDHIYVYDFVGTPGDVPPESAYSQPATAQSGQQEQADIALNREVGSELAQALVEQISAMGLPAVHASRETVVENGAIVIRGTLLSVVQGSEVERVAIGLGEGAADLKVAVEGFEMTPNGLLELGKGDLDTEAGKTPGAAVGLVTFAATKNPIGLIVSTGVKLHDEKTGSATIQGKAREVAAQIAKELRPRFEQQGWIVPQAN